VHASKQAFLLKHPVSSSPLLCYTLIHHVLLPIAHSTIITFISALTSQPSPTFPQIRQEYAITFPSFSTKLLPSSQTPRQRGPGVTVTGPRIPIGEFSRSHPSPHTYRIRFEDGRVMILTWLTDAGTRWIGADA
jgi:hypothetical protein